MPLPPSSDYFDRSKFTSEELRLLQNYGTYMEALASGRLKNLLTEGEKRFQRVVNRRQVVKKTTRYEKLWLRYKQALSEAKTKRIEHMRSAIHRSKAYSDFSSKDTSYRTRKEGVEWYSNDAYKKGVHFPRGSRRR